MKFKDNSSQAKAMINEAKKKWLEAATELIKGEAQQLAPVDLGQLRDDIDTYVGDDEGQVGLNADHGFFNEFGTGEFAENGQGRKGGWVYPVTGKTDKNGKQKFRFTKGMKPRPFLRPAFRNNKQRVEDLAVRYFKEIK